MKDEKNRSVRNKMEKTEFFLWAKCVTQFKDSSWIFDFGEIELPAVAAKVRFYFDSPGAHLFSLTQEDRHVRFSPGAPVEEFFKFYSGLPFHLRMRSDQFCTHPVVRIAYHGKNDSTEFESEEAEKDWKRCVEIHETFLLAQKLEMISLHSNPVLNVQKDAEGKEITVMAPVSDRLFSEMMKEKRKTAEKRNKEIEEETEKLKRENHIVLEPHVTTICLE